MARLLALPESGQPWPAKRKGQEDRLGWAAHGVVAVEVLEKPLVADANTAPPRAVRCRLQLLAHRIHVCSHLLLLLLPASSPAGVSTAAGPHLYCWVVVVSGLTKRSSFA